MKISFPPQTREEGIERGDLQLCAQVLERVQQVPSFYGAAIPAEPSDPLGELHGVGEDPVPPQFENEASNGILIDAVIGSLEERGEENGASDLIWAAPGIKHVVRERKSVAGAVGFEEEVEEVVVEWRFTEMGFEIVEDLEGLRDPSDGGKGVYEEGSGVGGEGEAAEAGLVEEFLEAEVGVRKAAGSGVEEGLEGGGAMERWGVVAGGPVDEAEGGLGVVEGTDDLE